MTDMRRPLDPGIRTVLVTGVTGFLGKGILEAFRNRDTQVIAACREPQRLPNDFSGEIRVGDLTDAGYRSALVEGVDAICHAGTWGAFWGHAEAERRLFLEPALDLVGKAAEAGVKRFLLASTVAVSAPPSGGNPVPDDAPLSKSGFWPHLDMLIDIDQRMRALASEQNRMVHMRLGHFVGRGNTLGLVPAIIPRLKTRMVPWIGGGRARMPLATAEDMGEAFALAATVEGVAAYDNFNIHSGALPTMREVFTHIAREAGVPLPLASAPYWSGYVFGRLMEALPTRTPFLTRSLVRVSEDWNTPITRAERVLGFVPKGSWRQAVTASVAERRDLGFAWPSLSQELITVRPSRSA